MSRKQFTSGGNWLHQSPFVRADKNDVRKLVVRDGQHEYVFDEVE